MFGDNLTCIGLYPKVPFCVNRIGMVYTLYYLSGRSSSSYEETKENNARKHCRRHVTGMICSALEIPFCL
ncbi:MAG: hypothetical protein ACMUIP_05945, partial [bacterium]